MITHAARARSSQRPRKVVADGEARVLIPPIPPPCSLVPSVTTLLSSTTVSKALRQTLREKGLNDIAPHHQPRAHGTEHGMGPPFHLGTGRGGCGRCGGDIPPRLPQPHQTAS